ncbi:thiamine ABC transporter substrate binding subunit [Marinomonas sp. M1K-6]|uniref:Thiamine-binding periplasmic protein n=1 Tax=Marinomonas profundi TaxID=2726122 RepID=A0A847QV05_9GAMM|nr:thiamine ABC transporter substrate binding subunit [Marinomonas profundi]NLQ16508.1 thiamine ABC transporter substrate binding subunit [Marinomonas profundi]UDV03902.1 thiamine ABC transporter substrate binding subunit [Marinomonas profundi]
MKPFLLTTLFSTAVVSIGVAFSPLTFAKETLNVYTYDSFASDWGPGPKIKASFEQECGCELNFVALDSSVGILSRAQLEGKSSQADVLLGLDLNLMEAAKKTGLLAEHSVDTSNVTISGGWSDRFFVPFDQGHFAFIYNAETLQTPPTSLKEVVDNQALRVIYQDPRTSTPGLGLLLWMKSVYGNDAANAWARLASHTVTVTKSWSDAYGLFLKGEADVVLSYTTSPAYHIVAEDETKYQAAMASEGLYPQIEVAAMMKDAPHPALAKQFMQFILQPGFQSTVATGNWMLPVIELDEALPAAFDDAFKPSKNLVLPAAEVAKHRGAWVDEWLNATTR